MTLELTKKNKLKVVINKQTLYLSMISRTGLSGVITIVSKRTVVMVHIKIRIGKTPKEKISLWGDLEWVMAMRAVYQGAEAGAMNEVMARSVSVDCAYIMYGGSRVGVVKMIMIQLYVRTCG